MTEHVDQLAEKRNEGKATVFDLDPTDGFVSVRFPVSLGPGRVVVLTPHEARTWAAAFLEAADRAEKGST